MIWNITLKYHCNDFTKSFVLSPDRVAFRFHLKFLYAQRWICALGVSSRTPEKGPLTQLERHQGRTECDGHNEATSQGHSKDRSLNVPLDKPVLCSMSFQVDVGSTEGSILIALTFRSKGNIASQKKTKQKFSKKQKAWPHSFPFLQVSLKCTCASSLLKLRAVNEFNTLCCHSRSFLIWLYLPFHIYLQLSSQSLP